MRRANLGADDAEAEDHAGLADLEEGKQVHALVLRLLRRDETSVRICVCHSALFPTPTCLAINMLKAVWARAGVEGLVPQGEYGSSRGRARVGVVIASASASLQPSQGRRQQTRGRSFAEAT